MRRCRVPWEEAMVVYPASPLPSYRYSYILEWLYDLCVRLCRYYNVVFRTHHVAAAGSGWRNTFVLPPPCRSAGWGVTWGSKLKLLRRLDVCSTLHSFSFNFMKDNYSTEIRFILIVFTSKHSVSRLTARPSTSPPCGLSLHNLYCGSALPTSTIYWTC